MRTTMGYMGTTKGSCLPPTAASTPLEEGGAPPWFPFRAPRDATSGAWLADNGWEAAADSLRIRNSTCLASISKLLRYAYPKGA